MIKRAGKTILFITLAVCLAISSAWAVSGLISYQGKLTDAGGNPLDGLYSIRFYLYNVETGGSHLWSEQQDIQITNGIYNVQLGQAIRCCESPSSRFF
jgi:hypothetical protein